MHFSQIASFTVLVFAAIIGLPLSLPSHHSLASAVLAQTPSAHKAEAERLFQLGIQHADNNQLAVAAQLWQQALRLYQQIQASEREAQVSVLIGSVLIDLGDLPRGIQYSQQGLKLVRRLQMTELEAVTLVNLAGAYVKQNNTEDAIYYAQQGLTIAQQLKQLSTQSWALVWLSEAYFIQGNIHKAINHAQEALSIGKQDKNSLVEGIAALDLGLFSLQANDLYKATQYLEHGLAIAHKIQNPNLQGMALANLGATYTARGDSRKGIDYAQKSLKIGQQTRNSTLQVEALIVLANSHLGQEESSKAIDYAQQGLSISQQSNLLAAQGRVLAALGAAHLQQGEARKAIAYLEKGLQVTEKSKDLRSQGIILGALGGAYTLEGEYQNGLSYSHKALEISGQTQNKYVEVQGLLNLSTVYLLLGNDAYSAMYAIRAKVANQQLGEPAFEAIALNLLATGLLGSGESDVNTSIQYSKQSLEIAQKVGRPKLQLQALRTLALGFLAKGDDRQGVTTLEQRLQVARQINASLEEGFSLTLLAAAHINHGNLNQAQGYAQQGLAIAQQIKNQGMEQSALATLGEIFAESGQSSEAEAALKASLAITKLQREGLPDLEKVSFSDRSRHSYMTLQRVLISQNKVGEALEVAEQGRARAFVDLLNTRLLQTGNQTLEPTETTPSLKQIQRIAQEQNATLVQYSVLYRDRGSKWSNTLFVWVVQPTGKVTFRPVSLESLDQSLPNLVSTTRSVIGVEGRSDINVTLTEEKRQIEQAKQTRQLQFLHKLLIEPIADLLPTNPSDRIIFLPQDELFLVPFPALQDTNGQYLIEKHTILTAPSIQVLGLIRQTQGNRQSPANITHSPVLVVGNPAMPKVKSYPKEEPRQLTDLPAAQREAEAIAQLFKTQAMTGPEATKVKVLQRMPDARLIHLATHGLLNQFEMQPGAIALAPSGNGQDNDGLLFTEELLDMNLKAELVVLSACDTGRGRVTGDGVIGLSRSFMTIGVPSVIVSLWAVPDAPTAELMTRFYKNWQERKLDKAQALRQAMLETLKTHKNPKDWAAFTLMGEAE